MITDALLKCFLHVEKEDDTSSSALRSRIGSFAGLVGIVCNTLLCLAKMLIGFLSGSVSIVADAVNNLADAASNIVSLLGFRLASRPPDKDHPYGHGRMEYLSGFLVAALIILVGFELLKTSIDKVIHPASVEFSWVLVIVLALAIAVKFWMAGFNKALGQRINSQTLIATGIDSRNDVISTAAVLLAALISHFFGIELDAWMGIAVALFIMYSGIGLVRETLDPLLGEAPDAELVSHIEEVALSYEEVLGIHDLVVHDYGPGRLFVSFHAEVAAEKPILESHDVIDCIEARFREEEGIEVSIHLDPIVISDPVVGETRIWLGNLLKEKLAPELSIHDFRMVPGESHTNLIFDVVLPYGLHLNGKECSPESLKHAIEDAVASERPGFFCVIQVDRELTGRV